MINNKAISKWFSMLLLMLVAGITGATAQSLSIGAVSIKAGETADVTVSLTDGPIYGIQTDIVLPAGLTVVDNSIVSLQEGVSADGNTLASGNYRVAVLSMPESGSVVAIANGEVFKLTVQADADFEGGSLALTGTELTTTTDGMTVTEVAEENEPTVEVTIVPENPTFSLTTYRFTEAQLLEIACITEGAAIYYTVDGTTPTAESTAYTGAIAIETTTTVKAIAILNGVSSEVINATYDIIETPTEGVSYYWKGYASGAYEVGGTLTATDANNADLTADDVNIANSVYRTIRLRGAKDFTTNVVKITLNEALKAGDKIYITAYRNKDATGKASGVKMKFDKGSSVIGSTTGMEFVNINAAVAASDEYATEPNTCEFEVPADVAGSTVITMTRFNTATNLFITKIEIIPAEEPVVALPAFSLAAGTYTGTQTVELSCTTEGAAIYYTTDGTDPSADNGTPYSEPISVEATMTIKAIAIAGEASSEIVTAAYTIEEEITGERELFYWNDYTAANEIALADGVTLAITGNETKNISNGNSITIDGTQYTSFKLSNGAQNTLTLKKKAKAIIFYSYVNADSGDSYWKEVAGVNYAAETSGGVMASFKDGANPDKRTYKLATPTKVITFNNAGKQLCYVMEVVYSDEVEAPAAPTFSVDEGEYDAAQTVELACETEGATIYYTIDGNDPTSESTSYSEAITISETTTIKAIAIKDGVSSEMAEATYTITEPNVTITAIEAPELLASGFSSEVKVTVSSAIDIENAVVTLLLGDREAGTSEAVNIAAGKEVSIPMMVNANYGIGDYTLGATLTYDGLEDGPVGCADEVKRTVRVTYAGDPNGDFYVDVTDAVLTVSFALETVEPTETQFKLADMNESGDITVSDAVAVVTKASGLFFARENERQMTQGVNYLTQDGTEIGLVNTIDFAGFQMDVTLSDGDVLNGVRLTERGTGLQLFTHRVGQNTWRVIALSLDGTVISGSEGSLLSLDITGNGQTSFSHIEFTDTAAQAYQLGFGSPTGINATYNNKVDGKVYTVGGTRTGSMKKGVNVVRQADGQVRKVLVK